MGTVQSFCAICCKRNFRRSTHIRIGYQVVGGQERRPPSSLAKILDETVSSTSMGIPVPRGGTRSPTGRTLEDAGIYGQSRSRVRWF